MKIASVISSSKKRAEKSAGGSRKTTGRQTLHCPGG